jgi:tetratricopeptide (TPR) repeat protein
MRAFAVIILVLILVKADCKAQQPDSIDIRHYFYKYLHNGIVCYERGDLDEAVYFFETANKIFPHDTASLLNLLHICLDRKDYECALNHAQRLLKIQYHRPSVYSLISSIELKKGNMNEALKALDAGLIKNQHDKMLFQMKANLLLDDNREREAISVIKQMIKATGETQYYSDIGVIYENLQEVDSSIAAYETCLTYHPTHVECLHGIGFLKFMCGEIKKEAAYALPFENTEQFKMLISEARENYIQSKKYLDKALMLAPHNESLRELLLRVERRLIDN